MKSASAVACLSAFANASQTGADSITSCRDRMLRPLSKRARGVRQRFVIRKCLPVGGGLNFRVVVGRAPKSPHLSGARENNPSAVGVYRIGFGLPGLENCGTKASDAAETTKTMRPKTALSLALILTTLLTLVQPPSRAASAQTAEGTGGDDTEKGLSFRLSEGEEKPERPAPNRVAAAAPLSDDETARLLARLPPLRREAGDAEEFKLREGSLPPPRAGQTVEAAFAPEASGGPPRPARPDAPLEVLRFAPEGEVELAPALSVTFSQPMVPISSQEEAAESVPVRLTPQPAGRWRWLSAQTLVFQPEAEGGRMPMATSYTVAVPAGTKSALGGALAEAKTFAFSTPPPTLKSSYPAGEGLPRDTPIFLEFDQRVDSARVLERLEVQPAAGVRLRQATPEEIAAGKDVSELIKHATEGRWLALRAVGAGGATRDALPPDTTVKVVIPAGTPSAEGPRVTAAAQSFSFKTYGAMRVKQTACGDEKRCSPFDDLSLKFNNAPDAKSFRPSQVRVSPEIPGAKISLAEDTIQIQGYKRSNTTYTVTLERSLKDNFGRRSRARTGSSSKSRPPGRASTPKAKASSCSTPPPATPSTSTASTTAG
jgi:alpha-2-macroglobulin